MLDSLRKASPTRAARLSGPGRRPKTEEYCTRTVTGTGSGRLSVTIVLGPVRSGILAGREAIPPGPRTQTDSFSENRKRWFLPTRRLLNKGRRRKVSYARAALSTERRAIARF